MKTKLRVGGKIVAITKQGAEVRLDNGRRGFVSTTDYFWNEWVSKQNLSAGDSLKFDVLGVMPDGRVSLGFEPSGPRQKHLPGINVQYVTSLEEVRAECPGEVEAIERHPLFHEEDDEGYCGWMRVARLLDDCPPDGDDEDDEVEDGDETEDNSTADHDDDDEHDEDETEDDGRLEDELLDLAKTLLRNFKKTTELELMLTTLGWESCDRIHQLPLVAAEGWIDQEGRCCVFTVHGMEEVTPAGIRFYERSECRAWAQIG